jgi:uncharacterized glyoxalase superfamily protein PhnB
MKVNSISGVTCYVKDLSFLNIKVDDVEGFHKDMLSAGMEPVSEPQVRPSGNREFVLRDPDGYKLLFFQKK